MGGVSLLLFGITSYFIMGVIMYRLGYSAYRRSQFLENTGRSRENNRYFILAILFFVLICGIRFRVGKDCENYAAVLENFRLGRDFLYYLRQEEPMYVLSEALFTFLGSNRVLFLGWLAFLEIVFFYSALRSRSYLLPFVGLALIMGPHFQEWNNGIRQMIAACIFVYALVGLLDNKRRGKLKIWQYFIWIFVAFLMHKASVLLFPLVLLVYYNKKPQVLLSLGLLFVSFYLGRSRLPDTLFGGAEQLLTLMGYENYSDRFDYYLGFESRIQRYGPRKISVFLTYVLFAIFGRKMDGFYQNDRFYRVSYFLCMVYACFTEILISMKSLFSRPFNFFLPFFLIMSGYLLYYLKSTKKMYLYWIAVVLMCSYSILNCLANYTQPNEFVIYKLIFFHQ